MDDNKKAKILAHIDSIIAYAKQPGNEWLLDALRERLSIPSILNIEKYLGLDYIIDNKTVQLDYSFIKDENLRKILESDWREMLRYRCGTRNHCIDYEKYCIFAHFQCEGIVNYFFSVRMGDVFDINWFNGIIEQRNSINEERKRNGKKPYRVNTVSVYEQKTVNEIILKIDYNTKLYVIIGCFQNILGVTEQECTALSIALNKIRDIRNRCNHRAASANNITHNSEFNKVYSALSTFCMWTEELTSIYLTE